MVSSGASSIEGGQARQLGPGHEPSVCQAGYRAALYSKEQRIRRDRTVWTTVQAVLAPLQFIVFVVSLILVLRYLAYGEGYVLATVSILIKTAFLYLIMVTGAIWEKVVFGQYLFAPAFYWEDIVSMAVIFLHTAYIIALLGDWLGPHGQMLLALAAYAVYVVNATQFLLKLRAARMQAGSSVRLHALSPAAGASAVGPAG